ncbi:ATP-binding response regulator [Granulosicoccus sp. 3-233]|uniref:ATP-binding response regulator n=1 Tax=Granulosicoccus sp. 3-233 TaxID=3417969 RepID=UPI003D330302
MSRRWVAWIPGLAALICLVVMLYLLVQIDSTRKQLQDDGVLEFNFVQQVDHNLTGFAQSLLDYLLATPAERDQQRDLYIQNYDILYGSILHSGNSWLGHLTELQKAQEFMQRTREFLLRNEPYMSPDHTFGRDQLMQLKRESIELSQLIYGIGLEMFERKSIVRDAISRRMDDLYRALWFCSICFVLVSLTSVLLFVATMRRAASLRSAAQLTQTQLSTALDELTTGDIERRAQNRFMASASHDLRQPLHALGLYLNALRRHVSTDQGQLILSNINRSTEALNQLLNSMLDLSKLDAGVVDVNWTNLSLDAVFDNLHQNFLPEANQKELALDIQYSGLYVHSDQVLLERILGNLVANALNYTTAGSVSVRATSSDGQARICVSDTGPGIPNSEQDAIFNEYYQLQNPERDRSKGLGLGLSIVKRLTRLLDVELSLSSAEGIGSSFSLTLPLANSADIDSAGNSLQGSTSLCRDTLHGLSILVIDDEQDVRDGMQTLLIQHGCDVSIADSAEQACENIISEDWVPDLIIADYRLRDEKTGEMAIRQVREEVNMDVPAMIITGDTSPARLREATASGFLLLHKPVIADDLYKAITRLVGDRP